MKIIKNLSNKYPKLLTDYKNRLLVFEKEEDGFLYFRVYQFWDRSEFHDLFKITLEELKEQHLKPTCEPWMRFSSFSGQDKIAYSYMLDNIAKYL